MRIGVGIILLIDLFVRSLSIRAFFTNEGVLPLETLKEYNWSPVYFSFHALSGELWWQIVLFILNSCCVLFLIIGFRTRFFTFICWVFLTSLQNRNPFILQGGDDMLRILLFWSVFLPWGERYSIQKKSVYPNSYVSWSGFAYLLLVCSVFFFSAMLKTSPEWRTEGTALYYALSLDQIKMPLGSLIYHFPTLLKTLTFVVFYIELLAPFLLLMPFVPIKIRCIGLVAYALLFIGIGSTLYVGLFYIIGLVALIGLLPSSTMDWFENRFYKNHTYYDEFFNNMARPTLFKTTVVIKNCFIIAVMLFCLGMNLSSVRKFPYTLEPAIIAYGKVLRLEQNWGMFSPSILKDDGWFVYSGLNSKHQYIDIKHNTNPVSFKKPETGVTEFESDRWRKFHENYTFNNNNYMRPFYCKYLLRQWNKEHPDNTISDLAIFFMKETTLPDYHLKPVVKTTLCYCQEKN
ncbi:MAG: hypothetical protein V4565_13825 [Bacteroidota bacterium]